MREPLDAAGYVPYEFKADPVPDPVLSSVVYDVALGVDLLRSWPWFINVSRSFHPPIYWGRDHVMISSCVVPYKGYHIGSSSVVVPHVRIARA
jgi:hypothetical protein